MIELIKAHPYLAAFLTWLLAFLLCQTLFKSWNRFLRTVNIKRHGWPPQHCDADGDFKPTDPEQNKNDVTKKG